MNTHGVTLRSMRALHGPNLFTRKPVLQIELDIGPYEERPSSSFPSFVERLTALLPGLYQHACSVGRPGGFVERLQRRTYLAHICEHVALELQNIMGFDVGFGRARSTGERGVYRVVMAYLEEEPAHAAFETALDLTLAAMHDEPFDWVAERERLLELADTYRLGPFTAAIVDAARARGIPVLRLIPTDSLVQLGYGVYQKRIQASETSNTSAIAVSICQDKDLTNRLLRAVGVPSPAGRTVSSTEDAWAAAQEVGLPVVVKPADGNQGKGVSVNLLDEAALRAAYPIAAAFGKVLVERYVRGHDYRLLVVGGKLVTAARRDPAQVVGDGLQSVAELVALVNADPRRRPGHSSALTRIRLDDAADLALVQQDLTREVVPAAGQAVRLRSNANLSTGGTASDVTEQVHPQNARMAELAAQIVNLDVAGIDVICEDISRPLPEQGGAIVEINAAPGLRMHLHPTHGQGRDVGGPIVDVLYPNGAPARIPILAVTGTNGKTTVTRLLRHIYETARLVVGMTSTEGTYIAGECILEGDCSGPQSARAVLLHPRVQVAVLETARGGILREGLAFDRCRVGVVTNISADHLGLKGVNSLEELAQVKQVVVEAVAPDGAAVLNAEDPLVAEMAAATEAEVVYFGLSAQNHIVAAQLAAGRRAVVVEDGQVVLATGAVRVELIELARIPFTLGGAVGFQVQNALAATAAAWAEGLNPALIARALTTFTTDAATVPGRFNVGELEGVQLVVDYAHNRAAVAALGEAVAALGRRRTVLLFTLPGDRRDEDLRATLEATRPFADAYVLYDTLERRGRAEGEIPQLLSSWLPPDVPCVLAGGQQEGLALAWQQVRAGERLVLIADIVENAVHHLQELTSALEADAACVVQRGVRRVRSETSRRRRRADARGGPRRGACACAGRRERDLLHRRRPAAYHQPDRRLAALWLPPGALPSRCDHCRYLGRGGGDA
jgi:cyanophycin synthetase